MSKLISDILGAKEPEFSHRLHSWEQLAGRPGVDIRLSNEIRQAAKSIAGNLGLDPRDTTTKELYHALLKRAAEDSNLLSAKLGIVDEDDPTQMLDKCVAYVNGLDIPKYVWVVKASFLKSCLKARPPKKLMRLLGLRSADSMLKRDDIGELLVLANLVEKKEWTDKFAQSFAKLKPADFDEREIRIASLSGRRTKVLRSGGHDLRELFFVDRSAGVVVAAAPEKRFGGDVLLILVQILQAVRELRVHSAYSKHLSVQPDFSEKFAKLLGSNTDQAAGKDFVAGWSPFHRLTSHNPSVLDYFHPHIAAEDFLVPNTGFFIDTALDSPAFWQHTSHVALADGFGVVSCNVSDVVVSLVNSHGIGDAATYSVRRGLWDELWARYLVYEDVHQHVLSDD